MDALKSTDKETDKYILTGKPQNLKAKGLHVFSVQNKPTHSLKVNICVLKFQHEIPSNLPPFCGNRDEKINLFPLFMS